MLYTETWLFSKKAKRYVVSHKEVNKAHQGTHTTKKKQGHNLILNKNTNTTKNYTRKYQKGET